MPTGTSELTMEELQQLNTLISRINQLPGKIKAIREQAVKAKSDPNQFFLFKGMFRELGNYYQQFNDTWDQIQGFYTARGMTEAFPGTQEKNWPKTVQEYYYDACAVYESYMNPTPTPAAAANPANASLNESRLVRARLPQINLPTFSGNPQEWPLFRDTYKSLIHEEATLSDMEKFLFLVSGLSGPARSLIASVPLTEANYAQAWKVLTEHYDDKRKLAYTYLKQVMEFRPLSNRPNANALKTIITSVIEHIDSFKHLDIPDYGDFVLLYLVLRCLDPSTKQAFEKKYTDIQYPTYKNLVDFIKVEWKSMDVSSIDSDQGTRSKFPIVQAPGPSKPFHPRNALLVGVESQENKTTSFHKGQGPHKKTNSKDSSSCPICKASHSLYQCHTFKRLSAAEKLARLKEWPGCKNCLSGKHSTKACTSLRRCTICNLLHHTWLHLSSPPAPLPSAQPPSPAKDTDGITLGTISGEGEVLLGTALVQVKDVHGKCRTMRIVADSGSQFSFMTADCARKLGLIIQPSGHSITGIGQVSLPNTLGKVQCSIQPTMKSSSTELQTDVIVVSQITNDLPHSQLPSSIRDSYKGYALADPEFWKPATVDFLLGGDLFFDILTGKPVTVDPAIPKLLPTIFGFIIAGPLKTLPQTREGVNLFTQSRSELKDIMSKFWEMEEVTPVTLSSKEDIYCENHYQNTHYRLESGRYVVSLPVKDSIRNLQNTQGQAFKRLLNLETKLSKNPELHREYHQFMRDYIDLGHMKEVPSGTAAYTLPHHAVVKLHEHKIKLRTVFDASCKSPTGSLNDHLFVGPKLQLDIRDILTNFRVHQVVFTADIIKMYRQIMVDPADRKYQHILWRFNPSEAVKEYELCTVTYGESSAPFDAQRTIIQLVKDEGSSYPQASRALLEDIYVDDIATGASSLEEAQELMGQLISLLGKGCFQLSKWACNRQELLSGMQEGQCQTSAVTLSAEDEPRVKLLGMQWIPSRDIFTYQFTTPNWHATKRAILSAIARIYDPLGFLSPVVFYAKTILQDMWISNCGWDEPGPPEVCKRWQQFLSQLDEISKVRIQRCIVPTSTFASAIVGFSDASERGYSAVLYLLTRTGDDTYVHLLRAKTKLAPIKKMTIPRLELSGALLLSRLFRSCDKSMEKLAISDVKFFTDSQVVLGWLSTPSQKLNAFVAHRVVQILELTQSSQWNYVKTSDNPADCSSRGLLPSAIVDHHLWWAGPEWMRLPPTQWPSPPPASIDLPETKKEHPVLLSSEEPAKPHVISCLERSSSYLKLLRSIAYVLRFLKIRKNRSVQVGPITVPELRNALNVCVKVSNDYNKVDSKLLQSLNAFHDQYGVLRVGGRLQHSSLQYDAKHPIILSGKSHLAKLIVDHHHKAYMHMGPTGLRAMLHTKFWISSARNLVRQRIFKCVKCYKASHSPEVPRMGNLPEFRLKDGQVFHYVGVDLGGPFAIRESLRRKAPLGKAYLCLFICMATKAVHLELVSRCSTEAFLAALDRFVARKGRPVHIYTDCGTNFIGAANKLKDFLLLLKAAPAQSTIVQHAAAQSIEWSFNPPSAPHFGGIWEAGIKSAKSILNKVIGDTPMTFEELTTLFCSIEGILNSRPLTPVGSDNEAIEYLTPGHFLVGRPILSVPEENLLDEKVGPLERWNIVRQRSQHFWNRWRLEYLNILQQRRKWTKTNDNLQEGDLVIVKDQMNCHQRSWPMARVIATHPGNDGITRVVTIKTSSGTYKRPVAKLVPLKPINNDSEF